MAIAASLAETPESSAVDRCGSTDQVCPVWVGPLCSDCSLRFWGFLCCGFARFRCFFAASVQSDALQVELAAAIAASLAPAFTPAQVRVMQKEEGGGLGKLIMGIGAGMISVSLAGAAAYKYGSKPADDRKRQGQ